MQVGITVSFLQEKQIFLAKIGVDTAENEPLEVWGKIIQYYSFVSLAARSLRFKSQSRWKKKTKHR